MPHAAIPYGGYWSSPFARWQGSLSHLHSLRFAAYCGRLALHKRGIPAEVFDFGVFGQTVPQSAAFYGLPWLMSELGAPGVGGPTVNQACATGARIVTMAADAVREGQSKVALAISGDRVSNGPHLYYPNPKGPGGTGTHEDWVLDNFGRDPATGEGMLRTAENIAGRHGISTSEQNDVTLRRYQQYQDATAEDRAFQRRYMDLPFQVPDAALAKMQSVLEGDEGIHPTTAEGLQRLKPLAEGGTVTYGVQTHPADGTAAVIVTTPERAKELSSDWTIDIRILASAQARVEKAFMPEAPVPASRQALSRAELSINEIDAIKSHNPFAVNDIVFARSFNIDVMKLNNFGSSLVWGHPQGPTGLRAIIELIEELVQRGGGRGLFQGCAAGDTAMAVVLEVADRRGML